MSDDGARPEGPARVVALAAAFLLMPLAPGLLGSAGYLINQLDLWFVFMAPMGASVLVVVAGVLAILQCLCALAARGSTRHVVRRLALFTLIVSIGGGLGGCAGGCVWGYKVQKREWPSASDLTRDVAR